MAMKERTGRSRVSKADEIVNKIDVPAEAAATVHTRVRPASKTDEISKKIPGSSASAAPTRVRPASKTDEISKKISGSSAPAAPTRVRPSSKTDEISRKIPSPKPAADRRPANPAPQQASSRVTPPQPVSEPTAKKKSGCCLLPFTLAMAGIAAALIVLF